jgi:trehalose-6-phosphate synthase
VFCAFDKVHPLSGLKNKLLAYERLLDTRRGNSKNICLIQIGNAIEYIPNSATYMDSILTAKEEILAVVNRISSKYRGSIIYKE